MGGNWGGFSFEIETFFGSTIGAHSICGNWGGFSFEIETFVTVNRAPVAIGVATGAASRLRLKRLSGELRAPAPPRGNWGGFSFEIETTLDGSWEPFSLTWQLGRLLV